MAAAYWCILAAALLPYLWVAIAKTGAPGYNNKDPRSWVARQDSYRVRNAYAAHLNAFEAFPAFAAGVLMAQLAGVDSGRIDLLALLFVALRIVHGLFYLTAMHRLRSLAWTAGFACVVALMAQAALRVAGSA
jgi:uncharacterized MAPEG superfamily protein